MTFKRNHSLVSALASCGVLLGGLATTGCKQPDVACTSAHGGFAAKYELESGDPMSACGSFAGDVLGLNVYYADAGQRPDLEAGSVAIRPQYINNMVFYAADRGVVDLTRDDGTQAVGEFSSAKPLADDFCEAPNLEDATITLPEVPEEPEVLDDPATPDVDESAPAQPAQAATTVTYEWSEVRVLSTADAQGTQMTAKLHFEQDGCEADYSVTGVYPAVTCATDDDCADDLNGINPGFATRCDRTLDAVALAYSGEPDVGLCVLDGEPPAYE